jgi:hypothetical protein
MRVVKGPASLAGAQSERMLATRSDHGVFMRIAATGPQTVKTVSREEAMRAARYLAMTGPRPCPSDEDRGAREVAGRTGA